MAYAIEVKTPGMLTPNEFISVPTDVTEFIHRARIGMYDTMNSGTDYPGALQVGTTLQTILSQEKFLQREIRMFSALFVIALEGDNEQSSSAQQDILQFLSLIDLKKYWN